MALTLTGRSGQLVWVYHLAARVGAWTLTSTGGPGASLTAAVEDADAYRITQRPITFVVHRPSGPPWRWPVETLQVHGDTLTAALGPFEE
jgi:hypothetical protein